MNSQPTTNQAPQVSYSLNLKRGYIEDYIGEYYRVIGDTRSFDNSLNTVLKGA